MFKELDVTLFVEIATFLTEGEDLLALERIDKEHKGLFEKYVWKEATALLPDWEWSGSMWCWKWAYWRALNWEKNGGDHCKRRTMSKVKRWLRDNECNVVGRQLNGKRLTHLSLARGRYAVPTEETKQFFGVYADSITKGDKVYLIETRTPVYRMFVDMDYTVTRPISGTRLLMHVSAMQKMMGDVYGSLVDCGALVCTSQCKKLESGDYKCGVHVIWTNITVTDADALALRELFIEELTKRDNTVDWPKAVDPTVYKGSGLRMLWSHKVEKCLVCNPKVKNISCVFCRGSGSMHSQRSYTLSYYLNGDGSLKSSEEHYDLACDRIKLLELASIQTAETKATRGSVPKATGVSESNSRKRKASEIVKKGTTNRGGGGGIFDKQAPLGAEHAIITTLLPHLFADPNLRGGVCMDDITEIIPFNQNGKVAFYRINVDNQWCFHRGRAHKNSGVYYVLTTRGLKAKCYSPHCGGRDYLVPMNWRAVGLAFPQTYAEWNVKKKKRGS